MEGLLPLKVFPFTLSYLFMRCRSDMFQCQQMTSENQTDKEQSYALGNMFK